MCSLPIDLFYDAFRKDSVCIDFWLKVILVLVSCVFSLWQMLSTLFQLPTRLVSFCFFESCYSLVIIIILSVVKNIFIILYKRKIQIKTAFKKVINWFDDDDDNDYEMVMILTLCKLLVGHDTDSDDDDIQWCFFVAWWFLSVYVFISVIELERVLVYVCI